VVALRAIQGEAAAKCLVELKRQEKDPEVMKVLEGTGTPVHPKMGIPKDTILEEPINLGVDMEDNQKPQ